MFTFKDWPERQTYEGIEGARQFMADWLEAWDDWEHLRMRMYASPDEALHAAGLRGVGDVAGERGRRARALRRA
jgi:hypothetical protein